MLSPRHLRRRWAGILSVLVVSILVAAVLALLATMMKRHEQVLDRRGRRTMAVVIDTANRNRWGDTATLRYVDDGREYRADVTVGDTGDFPVGSQVEVVYDPEHPTHAKPVRGWSPSYESVLIVAGMVMAVGVAQSARRSVLTAVARRATGRTALRVETFQLRRWWQRWPHQWAALWPVGADPTSVDATLYLPVDDLARKHAIGFEEPTTVLGDPAPGRFVVLVHGDRVIWPRGRARREPPGGSTVGGRVRMEGSWSRWP
jgi:hypothetical protein